jgi:deoxyribose-phosphate aldolase
LRNTAGNGGYNELLVEDLVVSAKLTEAEKVRICEIVTGAGATPEDVALFRKHIGNHLKVKAVRGIKTGEGMATFLNAGCGVSDQGG